MTRPARRLPGEGYVGQYTTKGGVRYEAQLDLLVDPDEPGGKRRRKKKGGFTSRRDAADWLNDEIIAVERGHRSLLGDGPTLGEFMSQWLDGHRAGSTTMAAYRRNFRIHIDPNLGDVPVGRLRPGNLASFYRQLEKNGRKTAGREGEPLGPSTVKKIHDTLSVCLQSALEDGLIAANPARHPGAKPPTGRQVKAARREMTVWGPEELRRFIA